MIRRHVFPNKSVILPQSTRIYASPDAGLTNTIMLRRQWKMEGSLFAMSSTNMSFADMASVNFTLAIEHARRAPINAAFCCVGGNSISVMIASSAGDLELLSHLSGGWVITLFGDNVADPALLAAADRVMRSGSISSVIFFRPDVLVENQIFWSEVKSWDLV